MMTNIIKTLVKVRLLNVWVWFSIDTRTSSKLERKINILIDHSANSKDISDVTYSCKYANQRTIDW